MGLGVAAEYVLEIGIEAIWERVQHIAGVLRQQLQELQGVTVQDRGRLLCGIVSFTMVRLLCFIVCSRLQASLIAVFISVLLSLSSQQTTVRHLLLAKVQSVQYTLIAHTAQYYKQHCDERLASLHCRTGKFMHTSGRLLRAVTD